MKKNLFVDTSVICALYNKEDSLYLKAQKVKPLFTVTSLQITPLQSPLGQNNESHSQ